MFDLLDHYRVNELHVRDDADTGLKAFIAIHDTRMGPALGGCRFIHYSSDDQAIKDAVQLARGMSYKAAMANVPQGGGKSVIMKPQGPFDKHALFAEFGRFVDSLQGKYITAIDSGTTAEEMDTISQNTDHVTSTSSSDNPSIYTARGVYEGIKAAVQHKLDQSSLNGLKVVIQGVGNVGSILGQLLYESGAKVVVSDICQARIDNALASFAYKSVAPDKVYSEPCAVFAPCGLSGVINENTISQLACRIIAGSANVQLQHHEIGQVLRDKSILYAPDYVINSGGLIFASLTHNRMSVDSINDKVNGISTTLTEIFEHAEKHQEATNLIADSIARSRLEQHISRAA